MRVAGHSFGFGHPWTPVVRALILLNAGTWLLGLLSGVDLTASPLALETDRVFGAGRPWQLVTYLFVHAGVFHLAFNMLALWMFGAEVEERMGGREFLGYYLLTGVGAGLAITAADLLGGRPSTVVGASGAVFGVLCAYGVFFARRRITLLLLLVLPLTMEARTFVLLFALLELLLGIDPRGGGGIAHGAHLGGMAVGWLYLRLLRPRLPLRAGAWGAPGVLLGRRDPEDERARLDAILDKVNRLGIHTLTPGERAFLDEMSRRYH